MSHEEIPHNASRVDWPLTSAVCGLLSKGPNMKRNRTLLVGCMICLLFLGIAGRAYVLQTVHTYSGACEKLHGVPGLLQRAGFVPEGDCKVDKDHDCKSQACEVWGKKGQCEEQRLDPKTVICVCVPERPSR